MLSLPTLALWATYALSAGGTIWLARRFAGPVSRRVAILLAVLPLVFTGKAIFLGQLYGPADLYSASVPWRAGAAARGVATPVDPILSDLAFANIPWRAAVRDSIANGRFPFWNRFVLAGNPLLAASQAAIFHPATWLGILLPLALGWTFSCTFTIFLALLSGFLFFRDFELAEGPALFGSVAWGFSTYLLFWVGWSVGPSTATFPLLLLGLRRIARGGDRGIALTAAGLLLSLAGGHPESLFHSAAAAGVVFVADLLARARRLSRADARRPPPLSLAIPLRRAFAAGTLAFALAGPQLFPLLEAIPHTAEYRERRERLAAGTVSQSVPAPEAARRLLPALLPFAHGIYGKSPVQQEHRDGSGMPLAYAGAILFPFVALGLSRRREGRGVFACLAAAGLLLGASAPGLLDVLTRLPGFSLALNYRLVFLAPLGLAGLAAFGADSARAPGGGRRLAVAAGAALAIVGAAAFFAQGVFRERALPPEFLFRSAAFELAPLALLAVAGAAAASRLRREALVAAAILILVLQRGLEMGATYPTQDGANLAPPSVALELVRAASASGVRVVAAGSELRPNGAALYGLEDVRGYESIVLDRFADTYPLWCAPQPASFNRVDDLSRPFLEFLGARFSVGAPDAPAPRGWLVRGRSEEAALFECPRALPRAFVPALLRGEGVAGSTVAAMAGASDFSRIAWTSDVAAGQEVANPACRLASRTDGPDLVLESESRAPVFVATSLTDWPGWRAREGTESFPLSTVNHAFVGLRLPAGRHTVRLHYRPPSFVAGLAALAAGVLALAAAAVRGRTSGGGRPR